MEGINVPCGTPDGFAGVCPNVTAEGAVDIAFGVPSFAGPGIAGVIDGLKGIAGFAGTAGGGNTADLMSVSFDGGGVAGAVGGTEGIILGAAGGGVPGTDGFGNT